MIDGNQINEAAARAMQSAAGRGDVDWYDRSGADAIFAIVEDSHEGLSPDELLAVGAVFAMGIQTGLMLAEMGVEL